MAQEEPAQMGLEEIKMVVLEELAVTEEEQQGFV